MSLNRENAGGIVPSGSFASMDLNNTPLDIAAMNLPRPPAPGAAATVAVSRVELARMHAATRHSRSLGYAEPGQRA